MDTFKEKEEIDVAAARDGTARIRADKQEAVDKLNAMLKELGL